MFFVILPWYFWCSLQLCLILHCKFFTCRSTSFIVFFCIWFWFFYFHCWSLRFRLHFIPFKHSIFFGFDVLGHSHDFGTNCFVFCFFHLFAVVLNANLLDVLKANPMYFITKLTVFFVGDYDNCMHECYRVIFWTPHKENLLLIVFCFLIGKHTCYQVSDECDSCFQCLLDCLHKHQ